MQLQKFIDPRAASKGAGGWKLPVVSRKAVENVEEDAWRASGCTQPMIESSRQGCVRGSSSVKQGSRMRHDMPKITKPSSSFDETFRSFPGRCFVPAPPRVHLLKPPEEQLPRRALELRISLGHFAASRQAHPMPPLNPGNVHHLSPAIGPYTATQSLQICTVQSSSANVKHRGSFVLALNAPSSSSEARSSSLQRACLSGASGWERHVSPSNFNVTE